MLYTLCRDCVFAEWYGNKQSGCKFDRLEKFESQGTEVILEDDGDKQYGRIVGRICNTCRHPSTVADIPARNWMKEVRQEVIVRVAMAVYVDNDDQLIEAFRSLRSIHDQTVKPREIILIYNVDGEEAPPDYAIWFTTFSNDVPWRIQSIKGVPIPLTDQLTEASYGDSVDLTMKAKNMESIYFAICKAGYEFPLDYLKTIDNAINDRLERFIALLPDEDGNGLFVQRSLFNFIQGNKKVEECEDVIDKIRYIAREEGTSHMIKNFEDLRN